MKHLTGIDHAWTAYTNGLPTWTVRTHISVPYQEEPEVHCHVAAIDTVEWRMAEYGIDNMDDALHLIMHEWMLHHYLYKAPEVNLWTPGYTPESALAHQLKRIDDITSATHKNLSTSDKKLLHKNPIHKHEVFDPLREQGVHEVKLHTRKLHISGQLDIRGGRYKNGRAKVNEAEKLFREEGSREANRA